MLGYGMDIAIPLLPLCACLAWNGTNFPFFISLFIVLTSLVAQTATHLEGSWGGRKILTMICEAGEI
jgi:hypothetical protein